MELNTSVEDWLRSLGLLAYTEAFIDNGYDDLDICKQIGDEDLDAIGVINSKDRKDILTSVKLLQDKGVNAVYFQLEGDEATEHFGQTDREKYKREVLIKKMKDLLKEDNCVLPENNPNAEHDPLDDLAQYYADQLYTYLQDVREVLEYLRDGESNEGLNDVLHSLPKDEMKKSLNTKLIKESRLSKSLNSLETTSIKGKPPKSPKHGIGRIFSGKKSKNNIQQPPKISGPTETAMILASQIRMSDEDRKNLMLKVKHGDITQEEAMNNFLSYEATHTSFSKEQEKAESKHQKKKRGFFNRSSFKRHSSGHSSDVVASNDAMGEMERLELMRKIKAGEMTTDEAWDSLRRFGTKRESKKSPKLNRRSSKSYRERERISCSNTHLSSRCSTFYTAGIEDISQSTSNIPSRTGSTDSSPDSTPGLPRKWDRQHGGGSSVEQLHSSGSFESMDSKGNYKNQRLSQKRSPSPLAHNQVRRTLSAKTSSEVPREYKDAQRRSTLSSFADVNESPTPAATVTNERISENSDDKNDTNAELILGKGPPVPPRKLPKLPPNKPLSHIQNKTSEPQEKIEGAQDTSREEKIHENNENSEELQKPKIPERPSVPTKPTALARKPPVTAKPQQKLNSPDKNKQNKPTKPDRTTAKQDKTTGDPEKKENTTPLVNGTDNKSPVLRTKGEATKEEKVSSRIIPSRPSPFTKRISRDKPLGPGLLEMIETKLTAEGIDFAQEPYTLQDGEWGVPMTLVDRYSCELNSTMREVVKEMDHIRIEKLNQVNKMATPCDLTTVRFAPDVVGKLTSLVDWLTSLGLPMYIDHLMEAGYDDIHEIPYLSVEHLNYANITNPEHIKRLTRSLENMIPTYEPDSPFGDD